MAGRVSGACLRVCALNWVKYNYCTTELLVVYTVYRYSIILNYNVQYEYGYLYICTYRSTGMILVLYEY